MTSSNVAPPICWTVVGGLLAATLSVLSGASDASAESSTTSKPLRAATPAGNRALERPPPAPGHSFPRVELSIEAPNPYGPWTMRVSNVGDVPVRLVADVRLLGLEVTPRGARKGVLCELPDDMRPGDYSDRGLVLPPRRSYAERFEPRLHCFGDRLKALAPGAIVVGHFGSAGAKGRRQATPAFVVSPLEGVEPELGALASIASPPIAVPDEATATPLEPEDPRDPADPDGVPRLSLRGAAAVDSVRPKEIAIPVTLRNDGTRRVVVRFRPEALGFDVVGPAGIEHCVWPGLPAAPMRELFSVLAPNEAVTMTVLLDAYCPGHALDQGGLAVIRPWLDTRKASGAALGLRTFDGQVIATAPTLLRLHRGAAATEAPPPSLEPPNDAPPPR